MNSNSSLTMITKCLGSIMIIIGGFQPSDQGLIPCRGSKIFNGIEMIYTVGKIDIYENYLDTDPDAAKGKTGSVWQTLEDIQKYVNGNSSLRNFRVYGVEADWELDTEIIEGENWRSLIRSAKLVRLD